MLFVLHQVLLRNPQLTVKWAFELNPEVPLLLPHSLQLEYSQYPCRFEREGEREREREEGIREYDSVRYTW